MPRRQWRNPVAEKTVEASQTPGRDGLYNTEEASAAKERARPRTRTRGQQRVEWLGPHNEGAEGAEEAEGDEGDAESHYTMADSVCAGGTVERTRRTARPRTVGTACSSWPEGVPRDFSLEASKAPVLFHQKWCFLGCLLVLAWGETTNRTMADGREWYSCRTIRCGLGNWQDCGAGLWNRRQAHGVLAVTGSIPLGGSPRLLSATRALLP